MTQYIALAIFFLALLTVGFLQLKGKKNKQPKPQRPSYKPVSTLKGTKLENDIFNLINEQRELRGIAPLVKDDNAVRYAKTRLNDFPTKVGQVNHDGFNPTPLKAKG